MSDSSIKPSSYPPCLYERKISILGRLSDAWRALQQMKKGADNHPDGILPPMYSGAMFLLLKRVAFSLTQRGYYSHRDYSVKKMTRTMKLTVASTLAVDIVRCHDAYQMSEEAR